MTSLDKLKRKIAESMARGRIGLENQKYGELVIQTNKVQFFLTLVVIQKSSLPDKAYMDNLFERAELGNIISLFQASAHRTVASYKLLVALKKYNDIRRRLAHKMYSSKRLTLAECNPAILEGERILKTLERMAKIRAKKKNESIIPKFGEHN